VDCPQRFRLFVQSLIILFIESNFEDDFLLAPFGQQRQGRRTLCLASRS
jgi:hypothetical protein